MTAPISHGYPDFGRTLARANVIYHNFSDADIDASETLASRFCGDRAFLTFRFFAVTNHFNLRFEFWDSASGGSFLAVDIWSCRAGKFITGSIPVLGPWLRVVVAPSAVNSAYEFRVYGTDAPYWPDTGSSFNNNLYAQDGISIGAGATRTDNFALIWPGPATWHAASTAASWTSYLEAIDDVGTTSIIDRATQVQDGPGNRRLVYLPRALCRVRTTNNDASARTFFLFVTGHPRGLWG
jgi:hypothetical protein